MQRCSRCWRQAAGPTAVRHQAAPAATLPSSQSAESCLSDWNVLLLPSHAYCKELPSATPSPRLCTSCQRAGWKSSASTGTCCRLPGVPLVSTGDVQVEVLGPTFQDSAHQGVPLQARAHWPGVHAAKGPGGQARQRPCLQALPSMARVLLPAPPAGVAESVVAFVKEHGADLVAVGSRGMGAVKSTLMSLVGLGSVSGGCPTPGTSMFESALSSQS